jgi:[protein-PII] uridylyltransferase
VSAGAALEAYLEALSAGDRESTDTNLARVVRRYLEAGREQLERLHRRVHSGRAVNEAHSALMDRLVRQLFALAEERAYAEVQATPHRLCVAAVGGYGRREMSIHSDVDLLFLHSEPLTDRAGGVAEQVQYWLWDAGLTVGCAIRTIAETCALAGEDATVATGVLDARFLAGDPDLFGEFAAEVDRVVLSDPVAFVRRQAEIRVERHAKFGESLYLLQPNLKEGVGGLRDYHSALWAMRSVRPSSREMDDFRHRGLLSERELAELEVALDFLWRVRNELHLILGRRTDQMGFAQQEQIARVFGYEGDGGAELPVERFMGDYYRHARTVENASDLVVDQCLARARPDPPAICSRTVEDGFRLVGDHLEIPDTAHLAERPVRLLTAFAVAQRHNVPLSRTGLRLIRENLDLMDGALRRNAEAAETFLAILAARHRVMRTLAAMNEVGLLGRFLPDWEHIVCRWQHVMYHTYTVDVHSIFLVEELRRLWRGKYERALPEMTELVRSVPDIPVLFLGCLLHDIGKGRGGQHSKRGAEIARRTLEGLGLTPERIDRIVFLVLHHLLMSHIAQRRDLSDPKVVVEFARLVGDRENLRNLYLLTFADTRASSPSAWTEWKGRLLRQLFERTSEFLEAGADDPRRALEQVDAQMEVHQAEAAEELRALGVGESKIWSYFDALPRRYFFSHTPREIARHALLVLAHSEEKAVTTAVREMEGGFSELLLCTKDVHALYAKVAGALTACGLNILGSHVYTTREGLALEVYRVTTPKGGDAPQTATGGVAALSGAPTSQGDGHQRGLGLLYDRRPLGGRPHGSPLRRHEHHRRTGARDLCLQGEHHPRSGCRHLLFEGHGAAEDHRSGAARAPAQRALRSALGSGRGDGWLTRGSSTLRATRSSPTCGWSAVWHPGRWRPTAVISHAWWNSSGGAACAARTSSGAPMSPTSSRAWRGRASGPGVVRAPWSPRGASCAICRPADACKGIPSRVWGHPAWSNGFPASFAQRRWRRCLERLPTPAPSTFAIVRCSRCSTGPGCG